MEGVALRQAGCRRESPKAVGDIPDQARFLLSGTRLEQRFFYHGTICI
jgi:hypothetical protein